MQEIHVSTWTELNESLFEDSWREELGRFRSNFAFRGMDNEARELTSGLLRHGGAQEGLEGHLLRNFRRYARREAVPEDSLWNWLALAQHHGLPTRLLDWTHSPYVALHFATDRLDRLDCDAIVWCVDYVQTNEYLPEPLRSLAEEEASNLFTTDLIARAAGSLAEFDALADEPFVVFCEPPSFDERIVNQYALFSLMSSPTERFDHWLDDKPAEIARKIVIPAQLRLEVRDKLDQANVTERVLFPGLDGLTRWLTRYYTPSGVVDDPRRLP
jgi:FRG domain